MSTPSNVLLPSNAKYFGLIDPKNAYNSNWDITWSFTYALTGSEHAICTFLTTQPVLTSGLPGHYLGYLGNASYLRDENNNIILNEYGSRIILDPSDLSAVDVGGVLGIAFDSTGYFALSSDVNTGIGRNSLKANSLVVRNFNNDVVFYDNLSNLDPSFVLSNNNVKDYNTIRIRYNNGGSKLYIDYKKSLTDYKNLLTLDLNGFIIDNYNVLHPGISFCSPLSSNSILPSTLFLSNFHTQGNVSPPTIERIAPKSLDPVKLNVFNILPPITAIPIN
jgi:hypothetical protein